MQMQRVANRKEGTHDVPTGLIEGLRERGYRMTPQRELLLSALNASAKHLDADALLRRVRKTYPRANKSVVYRNLELLTQLGLISCVDFGHGRVEYEVHRHPHHHHLVCRHCGSMIEVSSGAFAHLQQQLLKEYGFEADMDHLAIFGVCKICGWKVSPLNEHHPHAL
jgi:Fur family transcriptional regulator, ferric uptake regulator